MLVTDTSSHFLDISLPYWGPYIAIWWKRATLNILLYLWLLPASDL